MILVTWKTSVWCCPIPLWRIFRESFGVVLENSAKAKEWWEASHFEPILTMLKSIRKHLSANCTYQMFSIMERSTLGRIWITVLTPSTSMDDQQSSERLCWWRLLSLVVRSARGQNISAKYAKRNAAIFAKPMGKIVRLFASLAVPVWTLYQGII